MNNNRFLYIQEELNRYQPKQRISNVRRRNSTIATAQTKERTCPQMQEIEVSGDQFIADIFEYFFEQTVPVNKINDKLRQMAAEMMQTAIEASAAMDLIPRPTGGRPSINWVISQAVQIAFRRLNNQCKIYQIVKTTVRRNWRSAFEIERTLAISMSANSFTQRGVSYGQSRIDYKIPGVMAVIAQPKSMACWATAYTMLESWRRQQSITIETAMTDLGADWMNKFTGNLGLFKRDEPAFIQATGLVSYEPMSMSIGGYLDILKNNGPIWITANETPGGNWTLHARLIVGMKGDGTPGGTNLLIVDPAGGRQYEENFNVFWRKFEDEILRTGNARTQIMHWSEADARNAMSQTQSIAKSMSISEIQSLIKSVQFSTIPLDPGTGGRSIGQDALEVGDIILSTTTATISRAIRRMTSSAVSHSILYIGNGQVVESVGSGVEMKSLQQALSGASVAVAFRKPNLTSNQGLQIRDFAGQQLGRSYNYWGIVRQARFRINSQACRLFSDPAKRQQCENFVGHVYLGAGQNDTFFCSELILAAYRHAGVPLTAQPPHWGSPEDLANLRLTGMLEYVGHLRA